MRHRLRRCRRAPHSRSRKPCAANPDPRMIIRHPHGRRARGRRSALCGRVRPLLRPQHKTRTAQMPPGAQFYEQEREARRRCARYRGRGAEAPNTKLVRCWHPGRSKFGRTSMTRPVSASRAVDDRHRIDLDAPIRRKGIGKPARVPFTPTDTPAQRVR